MVWRIECRGRNKSTPASFNPLKKENDYASLSLRCSNHDAAIFAILLAACTIVPAAPAESNATRQQPKRQSRGSSRASPNCASPGMMMAVRAILRDLLDRFEADNPDIKVMSTPRPTPAADAAAPA
jgi:hypothetical protein